MLKLKFNCLNKRLYGLCGLYQVSNDRRITIRSGLVQSYTNNIGSGLQDWFSVQRRIQKICTGGPPIFGAHSCVAQRQKGARRGCILSFMGVWGSPPRKFYLLTGRSPSPLSVRAPPDHHRYHLSPGGSAPAGMYCCGQLWV